MDHRKEDKHPLRGRIRQALYGSSPVPQTASSLAERLEVSAARISYHLYVLDRQGEALHTGDGRYVSA